MHQSHSSIILATYWLAPILNIHGYVDALFKEHITEKGQPISGWIRLLGHGKLPRQEQNLKLPECLEDPFEGRGQQSQLPSLLEFRSVEVEECIKGLTRGFVLKLSREQRFHSYLADFFIANISEDY